MIDFASIEQQAQAGAIHLHGFHIAVQHPRNSYRKGKDSHGRAWANRMAAHYGEIKGTLGADGDPIDCYVGEWPYADNVYVVNQGFDGQFDEHKIMLGFYDQQAAVNAYQLSFPAQWQGLDSIVACSLSQFKWWLKNGNKQRKLEADHLPYEGTIMLKRIRWGQDGLPLNIGLDDLLMSIRREATLEAGDLLMDSVTMADILDDADEIVVLDALVRPFSALPRTAEVLRRAMNRTEFSIKATEPAQGADKVFTKNGKAQVAILFTLSDGQTITIYFHNPDNTPKKVTSSDDMISWKWLLNKRDITILVAPESGSDLNISEVAKRIMALADKNSASFQRINAKKAETTQRIEGLKTEITQLETDLENAKQRLEAAKSKKAVETSAADSKASKLTGSAIIKAALNKYGASLTEQGFIVNSSGTETDVKAVIKGKRLRFESRSGKLIASGPITEDFVSSFVERYWFWKVVTPSLTDALKAASVTPSPAISLTDALIKLGFDYNSTEMTDQGFERILNKQGYVVDSHPEKKEIWVYAPTGEVLYGGNFSYGVGHTRVTVADVAEYIHSLINDDMESKLESDPVEEPTTNKSVDLPDELTQEDGEESRYTLGQIASLTPSNPEDSPFSDLEKQQQLGAIDVKMPDEQEKEEKTVLANPTEPQAEVIDPYASRIEALKTMPRAEYDPAIDDLISELEEKGLLDQYEAQLTEIDKSRVNELSEMVGGANGVESRGKPDNATIEEGSSSESPMSEPISIENPDWKKAIALGYADDKSIITLAPGFESDFMRRLSSKATRMKEALVLSEKEKPQLDRIWDKYPKAATVLISDDGQVDFSARNAQVSADFDARLEQLKSKIEDAKTSLLSQGVPESVITEYVDTVTNGLSKNDVLADATIFDKSQVDKAFDDHIRKASKQAIESTKRFKINAMNESLSAISVDEVLSAIQSINGDFSKLPNDFEIQAGGFTLKLRPWMVNGTTPKLELLKLNGEFEFPLIGKETARYDQLDAVKSLLARVNKQLSASIVKKPIGDFSVEKVSLSKNGEDFTVTAKDGRIAKGFKDGGDWVIYEVDGSPVSSTSPEVMKISEDVKSFN